MSETTFTTISWRTLYDQAVAREPTEKDVAYRFTGRTFTNDEPSYGWCESTKGIYELGDWELNNQWDLLG